MPSVHQLREKIKELEGEIRAMQRVCPHPEGAYDVASVGYQGESGRDFNHCRCNLCDARFTRKTKLGEGPEDSIGSVM